MSIIQQLCPSCDRLLELPANATGRLAKCPACEATFIIGAETAGKPADAPGQPDPTPVDSTHQASTPPLDSAPLDSAPLDSAPLDSAPQFSAPLDSAPLDSAPLDSAPQFDATQTGEPESERMPGNPPPANGSMSTPAPSPPGANPFSAPLNSDTVVQTPMNPYRPTYEPDPVAEVGALQIVPRSIEEIFSPTLSVFGARWGFLVLAFVLVLIASLVVFVVPIIILAAIADAGGDVVAGIGMLLATPLMFLFTCYLSVGLARNAIAVARNSPSPMMELLPPLGIVVRFLVGAVAMALVIGLFGAVLVGFIVALAAVGGNEGLTGVVAVVGVFAGIVASMAAYWLLWAWVFIVSDGKGTALGSIQAAYTLTMNNKLTSVLLVVIATVLSTVGTSACYVGLLVTQPLTNLMFAVAYLMITNQKIDDPRVTRQAYLSPPPTQPTL